jgi:hypothetical protein
VLPLSERALASAVPRCFQIIFELDEVPLPVQPILRASQKSEFANAHGFLSIISSTIMPIMMPLL